jgi:hypothetical protein
MHRTAYCQVDTTTMRPGEWERLRTGIALKTFTALMKRYQHMSAAEEAKKLREARRFAKVRHCYIAALSCCLSCICCWCGVTKVRRLWRGAGCVCGTVAVQQWGVAVRVLVFGMDVCVCPLQNSTQHVQQSRSRG